MKLIVTAPVEAQYKGATERKMNNLAIWSKTVVEDTAMMAFTEPNFTRPS
jgi:hypothetical protein